MQYPVRYFPLFKVRSNILQESYLLKLNIAVSYKRPRQTQGCYITDFVEDDFDDDDDDDNNNNNNNNILNYADQKILHTKKIKNESL